MNKSYVVTSDKSRDWSEFRNNAYSCASITCFTSNQRIPNSLPNLDFSFFFIAYL